MTLHFSWNTKNSRRNAVTDAAVEINQTWDAGSERERHNPITSQNPPLVDVNAIVYRAMKKHGDTVDWATDRLIDRFRDDVLAEAYDVTRACLHLHGEHQQRLLEVRLFWLAAVLLGILPTDIDWIGSGIEARFAPWIPDTVFELVLIEETHEDGDVVDVDYTGHGPYTFDFARDQLRVIDEEHGNVHMWGVVEWDRLDYDDPNVQNPDMVSGEEWLADHLDPDAGPVEDVRIAGSRRACRQIVEAESTDDDDDPTPEPSHGSVYDDDDEVDEHPECTPTGTLVGVSYANDDGWERLPYLVRFTGADAYHSDLCSLVGEFLRVQGIDHVDFDFCFRPDHLKRFGFDVDAMDVVDFRFPKSGIDWNQWSRFEVQTTEHLDPMDDETDGTRVVQYDDVAEAFEAGSMVGRQLTTFQVDIVGIRPNPSRDRQWDGLSAIRDLIFRYNPDPATRGRTIAAVRSEGLLVDYDLDGLNDADLGISLLFERCATCGRPTTYLTEDDGPDCGRHSAPPKPDPTTDPAFVRCWTYHKERGVVCGGCPLFAYCPAMTSSPHTWGDWTREAVPTPSTPRISVQEPTLWIRSTDEDGWDPITREDADRFLQSWGIFDTTVSYWDAVHVYGFVVVRRMVIASDRLRYEEHARGLQGDAMDLFPPKGSRELNDPVPFDRFNEWVEAEFGDPNNDAGELNAERQLAAATHNPIPNPPWSERLNQTIRAFIDEVESDPDFEPPVDTQPLTIEIPAGGTYETAIEETTLVFGPCAKCGRPTTLSDLSLCQTHYVNWCGCGNPDPVVTRDAETTPRFQLDELRIEYNARTGNTVTVDPMGGATRIVGRLTVHTIEDDDTGIASREVFMLCCSDGSKFQIDGDKVEHESPIAWAVAKTRWVLDHNLV